MRQPEYRRAQRFITEEIVRALQADVLPTGNDLPKPAPIETLRRWSIVPIRTKPKVKNAWVLLTQEGRS